MRKRFLSGILALVMAVSLLPASAFAAGEGDTTETTESSLDQVTGGINGFMAGLTADAVTNQEENYKNAFVSNSTANGASTFKDTAGKDRSTALNGKIWADKSVTVNKAEDGKPDGTFGVTLSALGQTFSEKTETQSEVAYDVMLVLDFSGSMVNNNITGSRTTRAEAMVSAANTAIKALMSNANNRVGIIAYTGDSVTSTSNITEFFPLDRYTTTATNGNYLEYTSRTIRAIRGTSSGWPSQITYYVKNSSGTDVTESKSVTGGTPTQGGIYRAGEVLKSAPTKTTTGIDQSVARIPAIILLTDGAPGVASSGYYTDLTQNMTFGSGTPYEGTAHQGSNDAEVAAYTILTANAVKSAVSSTYWTQYKTQYEKMKGITESNVAKFYTIGLGVSDTSWTHFVMDPSTTVSFDNSGSTIVNNAKAILSRDDTYKDNYNYTNQYQGGENLTEAELTNIFKSFLDDIQTGGTIVDVGESTGGRNNMTFLETLGDGVRFDGDFTLTVPTYKIENGTMAQDQTRTYTLELYKEEKGEKVKFNDVTEATAYVADGNTLYLIPTKVKVGENDTATDLNEENSYDYAAMHNFSATVELQKSTNQRQLSVAIPPALMAYNVLNSSTAADGTTTYTGYYESDPVQLHYGVAVKDSTQAGEYLISAPNQCYLSFNPSYAGTGEGDNRVYNMPYYWTNQGKLPGDRADKNNNTTNSDSYVYNTVWGANKDVTIYLGNNGLYTLTGKNLTFNLHWNDEDNVDGKRFENISIQLYKQVVDLDQPGDYTTQYAPPTAVGDPVSLGLSNVPANNSNLWQYTFSGLPVYGDWEYNGNSGNGYVRYWIQFVEDPINGSNSQGYDVDLLYKSDGKTPENGHLYVQNKNEDNETWWWCFSTESGLRSNAALDVEFTREREMVDYTIVKQWDTTTIDEEKIPNSIEIQMYANGQAIKVEAGEGGVYSQKENVTGDGNVTITPDTTTGEWKATLTLPKNSAGGNAILYTPVEKDDSGDYTVTTTYDTTKDATTGEITGYTATLTNHASLNKTSLTVVKNWDDANDQDGKRADVTFKLTAMVGDQKLDDNALKTLLTSANTNEPSTQDGESNPLTKTLSVSSGNTENSVVWENLPTLSDGQPVTYSAVETAIGNNTVTDNKTDDYTVSYDTDVRGYVFVTNKHTPATVDLTITKTWDDGNNQDGKRPDSIGGVLYKKVANDTTPTAIRSFSISGWNGNSGDITISDLPKYEDGQEITYYVSENLSTNSGYTLKTAGLGTPETVDNVAAYPVSTTDANGTKTITLTNEHKPATLEYTVDINWVDNENRDQSRPGTVTISFVKEAREEGEQDTTYSITLNVSNDTFTVGTNTLPSGVSAAIENGRLTISNLPQYENGEYNYYSARILTEGDINSALTNAGYTVTMTDAKETSNAFTLSYTPGPITLTLTKNWSGDGTPPSTDAYRGYLTLKRKIQSGQDEVVYSYPAITKNEQTGSYTITYTGLDKYDGDGNLYTYSVTESKVPNYTTNNETVTFIKGNDGKYTASLTNTYSQETYQTITVTKTWNDNGDDQGKRPTYPDSNGKDPLDVKLYETFGGDEQEGIAPTSIIDNKNNTWTYTWTNNVPKYDANGSFITSYTAYENNLPPGYLPSSKVMEDTTIGELSLLDLMGQTETTYYHPYVDIPCGSDSTELTAVLNNYIDTTANATGSLTIVKTWNEDGYPGRTHSESLHFTVYGKTNSGATGYYDVTMSAPTTGDTWTTTVDNLPVVANGESIQYYVVENPVPDSYSVSYSTDNQNEKAVTLTKGNDDKYTATIIVTNKYTPQSHVLTYDANGGTGNVVAEGVTNNQQIVAPKNNPVTVAGQSNVTFGKNIFLGWATTTTSLIYTASDLQGMTLYGPQNNVDTSLSLTPTITVDKSMTLYAVWAVDENGDKIPDYLQKTITVNVVWDDDGNRCGIRPDSIGYTLAKGSETSSQTMALNDGKILVGADSTGKTMWTDTFVAGLNDTYSVAENSVTVTAKAHADTSDGNGYTAAVTTSDDGNTITITLIHTPEKISYTVNKTWDLGQSALEPASATFRLLGNGQPVEGQQDVTITYSDQSNSGSATWSEIPKYAEGKVIDYYAIETSVTDEDDNDIIAHFNVSYDWSTNPSTTTVTNTYSETRDITLVYEWDDNNNAAGVRPTSIEVQLQRSDDGTTWTNQGSAVSISEENADKWSTTWTGLEKLSDPNDDTSFIRYRAIVVGYTDADGDKHDTVDSQTPLSEENYDFQSLAFGQDSVFVMDSALNNDRVIQITKQWVYPDTISHPETVWVRVYHTVNGEDITATSVAVKDTASVTLPKYDSEGAEINYQVAEITTGNFTSAEPTGSMDTGFTIVNTLNGYNPDDNGKVYLTFKYENASAKHDDETIVADKAIELTYGSNYTFTATANSGYILNDVSYNPNVVTLQSYGGGSYEVKNLTQNATITIKAIKQSTGGGGGGGGGGGTTTPPALNTEDHYSYIIGYSDGTVRPNGNITRAEVATIFFRLLTDETRQTYWKQTNSYSDVPASMWYNNAISTLSNMGIINGYEDGTFRPDGNITRAEFAKIAVSFFETVQKDYQGYFPDVTSSAWYTAYVEAAVEAGLIQGYEDGTFRPNGNITRAESCVIVNRVLGRKPVTENLLPQDEMLVWPDNQPGAWYYADMQEATNSHDYTWTTLKGEKVEKWTQKLAQRDWAALEKAWANGNSAPGGEVVR